MKVFTLKQEATNVPAENVQDVEVRLLNKTILLITTKEGWVRVNLAEETFAVGAYEG